MKQKKKNGGFTLIELLVVIAIIALLLSIVTPGLKKARDTANRVICGTRLNQIGKGMKMYSDAFDGALPDDYYPYSTTSRERHGYLAYRLDATYTNGQLKPFRLAYLYELDYIDVPETFYCPGTRHPTYQYRSYIDPPPWGTLPQNYNISGTDSNIASNQWVRVGYTYYPIDRVPMLAGDGIPDAPTTKFIRLNPNLPYASDLLHNLTSLAHQTKVTRSVNALFPDGHVSFCNDPTVFELPIWEQVKDGVSSQRDYDRLYYTVFRMIRP